MAYADPDQLAVLLGYENGFTAAQTTRAQLLLDLATGEIDRETGQSLLDGVDDVVLDGPGTDTLVLPRWPVTAVTSVKEVDPDDGTETALTYRSDYTWSEDGLLRRIGAVWPRHARGVHVVYRAGFTAIGDDVRRICLAVAARGWPNPLGASQERLGDHAITYGTLGAELTAAEKSTLGNYQAKT